VHTRAWEDIKIQMLKRMTTPVLKELLSGTVRFGKFLSTFK